VFPVPASGVFQARLVAHDLLPDDDVASAVLDPAPLPAVLLVSQGNPYLERLLQVLPVARAVETRTADPRTWGAFGVVILDRTDPGPVPPGDYLMIDAVAPNIPAARAGEALQVPAGGAAAADLIHPDGRRQVVRAAEGMLLLPPLTRAGVYRLRGPGGDREITVLSADRRAGLIRPGTAPATARPAGP